MSKAIQAMKDLEEAKKQSRIETMKWVRASIKKNFGHIEGILIEKYGTERA